MSAITGSSGTKYKNGHANDIINTIAFEGMDGKTYGPYGGSLGENWESKIPLGCSVSYISGRGGGALDAISFHYQCPNGMYVIVCL